MHSRASDLPPPPDDCARAASELGRPSTSRAFHVARGVARIACVALLAACRPPPTSTGGPPVPGEIPSRRCAGDAPVDEKVRDVEGVRASWFNTPHGNERLYVLEAGPRASQKPTLLLFHGVGEVGTGDYYPVLAQLSRERHVLAVDLPGFGRSDPTDKDFGPDRLVSAVDNVVRVCAPGELDVLGHSSGAALALLFAAEHPRAVRRLIVADAAGILRPEVLLSGQLHQALKPLDDKAEGAQRVAQVVGGALIRAVQALVPNAKAIADTGLLGDSPSIHAATALLDYNFGYAIERVRAPTLVLWGEDDEVAPPRIAHLLDDRIPRSQLLFIPDSGHVLMKDQPERMAGAVDQYLTKPLEEEPSDTQKTTSAPRDVVCKGKVDQTFDGSYDQLTLDDCQNFRLHRAQAKRVRITGSRGRIDESKITEGLIVDDGELSVTGGTIGGEVAIDLKDSQLDLAGVIVRGDRAAILVREEAKIITSVTRVKSPHTDTILHEQLDLEQAQEL